MSSLTRAVGAAASRRPLDPVFRWAGGKRWLLPFLDELVEVVQPTSYYEPFVGGGAVFLGFDWPNPTISDINDELISAYRGIARDADAVADVLARFERSRRQYDTLKYEVATDDVYQAARMLYLEPMRLRRCLSHRPQRRLQRSVLRRSWDGVTLARNASGGGLVPPCVGLQSSPVTSKPRLR